MPSTSSPSDAPPRIISVDVLRGLVMFTMIFVNDLAGAPASIVPAWMRHFHGKSGMTFVDLVFPAFLFIVGMSIPFSLSARLARGEPLSKVILHILGRTSSLLVVGIMMVNETPDSKTMGWSGPLWVALMYFCAILAFASVPSSLKWFRAFRFIRIAGFLGLFLLALAFRGPQGERIISFAPFSIRTEWYGILGLIGWAYLMGAIVFLCFRGHRTAILGSAVLLMCLYPAAHAGLFQNFWLARFVNIGEALGSHASITVSGLLLASTLVAADASAVQARTKFTLLFIAGFSAAALLLHGLYGINKNAATPSWCLWASAITAAVWLICYYLSDVSPKPALVNPMAVAGQNVLLSYLLSEMLPSLLTLTGLAKWYDQIGQAGLPPAILRSALCGVLILYATALLNRLGFRLKL